MIFLYFDKQNEKKMFRDSKKRNVIFVLSIILGAISLFLWNSRCTMDNLISKKHLPIDGERNHVDYQHLWYIYNLCRYVLDCFVKE